jgi:hypothetical protein
MSAAQLTVIVESAVMLIFLFVLCLRFVASYRLDSFRQSMFALRDELFDYAAAGNIGFNDPAYRLLRQSMNGFIRYAHQLSFFRLIVNTLERQIYGVEQQMLWHEKWQEAIEKTKSEEVKERLLQFHMRSGQLAIDRIVGGSPLLIAVFAIAVICLILNGGWQNIKRVFNQAAALALSRVVDKNLIEEDAAACAMA